MFNECQYYALGNENQCAPKSVNIAYKRREILRFVAMTIAALIVIAFPATSYSAVRYVKPSCTNNGDGTAAACAASPGGVGAWKLFSNISWGALTAGSTLNLVDGETETHGLQVGASGTAGNPVTITVTNGGTFTIDMGNVAPSVGINFEGHSYVVIDGVVGDKIAGSTTYGIRTINIASAAGNNSYCVYEQNGGHHLTLKHLECTGQSQASNDDNAGGVFISVTGTGANVGHVELAYNWIHSSVPPVTISTITESGGTATITTASPHGFPAGSSQGGIKDTSVAAYMQRASDNSPIPARWVMTNTGSNTLTYSQTTFMDPNTSMPEKITAGLGTSNGGFIYFPWYVTGITLFGQDGTTSNTDNLVHNNYVQDMWNDGIRCGSDCSLYNNVVKHVDGSGHSDSLLIQSGGYSQVYNNYVEESADQNTYIDNLYDAQCTQIRIYNNVYNSNPGFGIVLDPEGAVGASTAASNCSGVSSSLDDIEIINNTFYSNSGSSVRKGRGNPVTNVVILNNIFPQPSSGGFTALDLFNSSSATITSSTSWDYDSFVGTSGTALSNFGGANKTLSQLQALSPARETNGKLGTPSYVDAVNGNFQLASGDTVAKGSGSNLTSPYSFASTDKNGNARPSMGAWDIGAINAASSCTPSKVVYTAQPSNAEVGSTLGTVSVSVEDSGGNVCTSDTSTVTLSSHAGSTAATLQSSSSLSKAASAGVATWTDLFVSPTTGTISIDAADGALTGATSSSITISCTPSKVVFTSQPGSTTIGSNLGTVTVAVQDSASITCSANTSSVTIANKAATCSGMTLGGTATGNAAAGIFTTSNLTENAAGACTLHATDGALTAADSSAFTISATAGGSTRGRMHR